MLKHRRRHAQHGQAPYNHRPQNFARSRILTAAALLVAVLQPVQAERSTAAVASESGRAASYIYHYIDTPTDRGNARAISDDRTVVGEYVEPFNHQPFVYTPTGGTQDLPLDTGFTGGAATAISPDAQIIGGMMWDVGLDGCTVVRWLRQPDGTYSTTHIVDGKKDVGQVGCSHEPTKITNAGRFDIQTTDAEGGYTWQDGTLTRTNGQPLGPRGAADGTFVESNGGVSTQHDPDGTVLTLDPLLNTAGEPHTLVAGITDYNEVIGSSIVGTVTGGKVAGHAVRWNADGSVVDLNDVTGYVGGNVEEVTLTIARSANLAGDIVGAAFNGLRSAKGPDGGSWEAPMFLEVLPPIVFVPGVAGSRIIDPSTFEDKWLGHEILGSARASNHAALTLSGPEAVPELVADKVLQNECVLILYCPDDLKLYGPFVDALKSTGMREYRTHTDPSDNPESFIPRRLTTDGCDVTQRPANPNLFLFPYDWRQSNAASAQKLKDFMGCVRKFYTGPVILAAHSMGGLLSRRYILNNPSYSNSVSQLITIGTPWLGAPQTIHRMLTGEFVQKLTDAPTIKRILPTMFGPRQLVPSDAYYQLADPPLREAAWDINDNGKQFDTYTRADVDALFDKENPDSTAVTDDAAAFHAITAQDDWRADNSKVQYHVIYARQALPTTIGQVVAGQGYVCVKTRAHGAEEYGCQVRKEISTTVTDGDGTVPVASAARMGAGLSLNNTDHQHLHEINTFDDFFDDELEHVYLPSNPQVIATVKLIAARERLSGVQLAGTSTLASESLAQPNTSDASGMHSAQAVSTRSTISPTQIAPAPPHADGWYVDVSGFKGSTTVVAPDGSTDAFLPDVGLRADLPSVTHISDGDSGDLVITPFTGADTYKVNFTAGDRPLMLDVRRGQQQAPDALTRWNDVSVPPNSEFTLTLAADGTSSLSYTDPSTGAATSLAPTASVSGFAAEFGLTPPTVSAGAIVLGGTRQYTLTATPGSAAVSRILWSVDGSSFRLYDGPIALDPNTSQLMVFADDAAGNRSAPQTLDLASSPITPVTTATTSPPVPASGFVSAPVTVRLHTRPSDGTTVSLTYSVSAPTKGTTTTTVNGDTATFTVSGDEKYVVRYRATDSAGHVEPERVLSFGIDQTAPTVSVATPAQASTVSTLSSVTGSAADSGSQVTRVDVAIQRNSDRTYWNGSTWSPAPVFQTTAGLSSWSLPGDLPKGDTLTAGGYSIVARAADAAGNTSSATSVFSVSAHAQIRPLNLPAGFSGGWQTRGYAINGSGQVAGEVDHSGVNPRPVRWDANGTATVLHTGSYGTSNCFCQGTLARGIDDSGAVTGRLPDSAVKWLPSGVAVRLTSRTGTLSKNDYPKSANALGTVAGTSASAWGTWPGSAFSALPVPATSPSVGWPVLGERYPMAINSVGKVVGTRLTNDPTKPVRAVATVADSSGAEFLFPPDSGWNSYAAGINDAGDIVGAGGTEASGGSPGSLGVPFLRSADGSVTRFPTVPGSDGAIAMDINNSDVIVGFAGEPTGGGEGAWVIHRGIVKTLADLLPAGSGWTLHNAWGINDSGQIVGNGVFNGQGRGYVLTLGGLQQLATPPRVADMSAATPAGTPVTVPLEAATTTTSPITWSVVDEPLHGSVVAGTGNALYTPAAGFTGQDSFTVQADDGAMKSNVATVSVTVGSPPPAPPVALIRAPSSAVAGTRVQVDGLDSYDPGLGPLTYRWDLTGDGTFSGPDGAVAFVTPTQPGAYTVGLKVTNAAGLSTVTQHSINVVAKPSSSLVAGSVNLTPSAPTTNATLTATPEGFAGGTGPLTYTYQWFNGTRQLATTSPILDLSVAGNGDRDDTISVRVTATDGQTQSSEITSEVQVANSAPSVTMSRASASATYSDPLPAVGVTARDDDADPLQLSASGLPASLVVADSGNGTGTVTGNAMAPAGTYHATVSASDGNLQSSAPLDITISPESASLNYTGATLVSTGSPTAASATVALEARVTQDGDGNLGDLTKASVAFDLFSSQNTSSTPDRTVLASVNSDGVATASLENIGIGSWSVVARIPAGNAFFQAPATDPSMVIVYQPEPGKFVVGGGWVRDPSYLNKPVAISPTNDHGNFGFSVRYKKDGKPTGQMVYVFRGSDGYTYTVKSNSWADGQFAVQPTGAAFSAQANVTVTNPATGLVVPGLGGGGYTFRVDVTDGTPSGAPDRFAITITTSGGALYHRAGTTGQQLLLGGGSILLHG